jgi:CRP-like cAMP-binding protein
MEAAPKTARGRKTQSCLVQRFERFVPLEPPEIELLESLEKEAREFPKNALVRAQNAPVENFYTLKSGWACSFRLLPNGGRQILDLFLPGDVMGLCDIAYPHSISGLATLTAAELCPFPRARLGELFECSPRLANLFFMINAREQAMLLERVVNLGRRMAIQKLAHFLVEIVVRLRRTDRGLDETFPLPLSQELLADALGLSPIHVNRTLRKLRERGLVEVDSGEIRLLDFERLQALGGFDPIYLKEAADWL